MWMSLAPSFAACVSSALSMRMIGASFAGLEQVFDRRQLLHHARQVDRALDLADHGGRARLAAGIGHGDAVGQRGGGLALERVDVVQAQHLGQRRQRHGLGRPQHEPLAVVLEQQRVRLGEGVGQGVAGAHGSVLVVGASRLAAAAARAAAGRSVGQRQHRRHRLATASRLGGASGGAPAPR